jgi:hypothetical protein
MLRSRSSLHSIRSQRSLLETYRSCRDRLLLVWIRLCNFAIFAASSPPITLVRSPKNNLTCYPNSDPGVMKV